MVKDFATVSHEIRYVYDEIGERYLTCATTQKIRVSMVPLGTVAKIAWTVGGVYADAVVAGACTAGLVLLCLHAGGVANGPIHN